MVAMAAGSRIKLIRWGMQPVISYVGLNSDGLSMKIFESGLCGPDCSWVTCEKVCRARRHLVCPLTRKNAVKRQKLERYRFVPFYIAAYGETGLLILC